MCDCECFRMLPNACVLSCSTKGCKKRSSSGCEHCFPASFAPERFSRCLRSKHQSYLGSDPWLGAEFGSLRCALRRCCFGSTMCAISFPQWSVRPTYADNLAAPHFQNCMVLFLEALKALKALPWEVASCVAQMRETQPETEASMVAGKLVAKTICFLLMPMLDPEFGGHWLSRNLTILA